MTLIAVIIGYILGVTPFVVYFLWQSGKFDRTEPTENEKNIFNEWLYGKQDNIALYDEKKQTNQEKIYKEYMTGEEIK